MGVSSGHVIKALTVAYKFVIVVKTGITLFYKNRPNTIMR
jgi:hypothetical protein